ncbi:alpha/beta fold hydrolase [Duganella radicis]|uniref:Alpha/beta fold hydrolase n=1 Tax=Duganella radicis TaxID=551988 RepID=A0A6L6PGF7_9BURK|nr:alpha/beta hydrolase [Duganella radicis]MTV37819.1 alpha/beta fold hydrolase [Duganella radicis]
MAGEFAVPHRLIDVGGGRKMNLYCSGHGAVTVVFDAPSGDAGWSWYRVQPEVAKHARACVFDRAGFGFSDPAATPNTSESVAADLHKLLAAAGEKAPYIMVGNSLGGANVQVYAYRHPSDVKGLVLVEAQHEDETARLNKVTDGKVKQIYAMVEGQGQYCLAAARKGFAQDAEAQANCIGKPLDTFGPQLGAALLASESKLSYWQANVAEYAAIATSDEQLRKLRRPFGDIPLVVLTRGVSPYAVPGQPQSALNKAFEDENYAVQKEFTKLSTRSTQRVVAGAGHVIQADKPEAVVDAVLEVLKQVTP